jgi:hypothetical protein
MPDLQTPPAQVPPPAATPPVTPPVTPPAATPPATLLTKPNENQPQPKVVPEKYDIKLPEGSKLDASHVEKIALFAKERGLSNEDAQAIVERDQKLLSAREEAMTQEVRKIVEGWPTQAKADPEIGGEAFDKNVELAKRVVDRIDKEGSLKKLLNESGYGNHPDVLRAFVRMGKMMTEDQLVIPGAQAGGKKSIEEVFYGPQANQ